MKIVLLDFWNVVESTGGTEKVLCNMANELIERNYDVSIICNDKNIGNTFFPLNSKVRFINIFEKYKIKNMLFLKIEREIKRCLNILDKEQYRIKFKHYNAIIYLSKILNSIKPDLIVTYDPDSLVVLKKFIKNNIPTIAMLHMNAEFFFNNNSSQDLISSFNKVNYIQILNKQDLHVVRTFCPKIKCIYIPNIVNINCEYKKWQNRKNLNFIIHVGRINGVQKRQEILIKAFEKVKEQFPEWKVNLIGGTGSKSELNYKTYLENYIYNNSLNTKISLLGEKKNVNNFLVQSDIFAFPSAYEGMPLALTEAMAAGLPAIGYKSCPSVNELIIDGYNGFLCEEGVDDFAEKLKILMEDAELRKKMGQNARESMKQFAPEKIWNEWEALINKVVTESKK